MAKRKSKRRTPPPPRPKESQTAELLTIAWSLTVVTLVVCDVGAAISRFFLREGQPPGAGEVLWVWLLFSSGVIGVVSLLLLPLVWRLRVEKPPRGFTVLAVVVAVAPLVMIAVLLAR
jgi:hypothetical protein